MLDVAQMRRARLDARVQHVAGLVRRAVINDNHFKSAALQGFVHLVQKNGEIFGFVLAGDDNGDFWLWQLSFLRREMRALLASKNGNGYVERG